MKSVAKNSLLNAFYAAADLLSPLLTSAYIARTLQADGVGSVFYAQSIASYFVILAEFGISDYGIRETAKVRENQNDKNHLFSELVIINLLSTTFALTGYLLLLLSGGFCKEIPLFLACGSGIFVNYINISWYFEGQEEYTYIFIRRMLIKLFSITAVLVWIHTKEDYVKYAWIPGLAEFGSRILDLLRLRRRVHFVFCGLSVRKHLRRLWIVMTGVVLNHIYGMVDVTMLGIFCAEEAAGYYSCAYASVHMTVLACTAFLPVCYPRLSDCCRNKPEEFAALLQYEIKLLLFISIPAGTVIFILAPHIITLLFGSSFSGAIKTSRVLSPLVFVKSAAVLCYYLIMVTGKEKRRAQALAFGIICRILLGFFLIPRWADCGAALAVLLCELGINVWLIRDVYHVLRFTIPWQALQQAGISTVIMGMAVRGCIQVGSSGVLKCLSGVLCGAGVYAALNLLMKNELMEMVTDRWRDAVYRRWNPDRK